MRTQRQFKTAICLVASVEMKAGKDHGFGQVSRRFGVPDACLAGPVRKAFNVRAPTKRDDPILMPGERPVAGSRLVEIYAAHRPGARQQSRRKPRDALYPAQQALACPQT